jgi:hypothetical protein
MARRWTAVIGVIVVALGVLSYQAYAAFSGDASATLSVGTATLTVTNEGDRFDIDATDMQPGDDVVRAVTVSYHGPVQNPTLTTTATVSSDLDTDTDHGLRVRVEACDQAWDETLSGGVPTGYDCGGSSDEIIAERPVIMSDVGIADHGVDGLTQHLVVHLVLPNDAPDSLAGLSSSIEFTFRAGQRDPGAR